MAEDDGFELYDLRVEVVAPEGARILCHARPGDWFELRGELLHLPPDQGFSIYSLAALLPLLPAKQRPTHRLDEHGYRGRLPRPALPDPVPHHPRRHTPVPPRRGQRGAAPLSEMETVSLAPGYLVSRLVKGGWQLAGGHGAVDPGFAQRDMERYLRAGITGFDCADIYTGVERMIGDFRRGLREAGEDGLLASLKVHTKFVPDLALLAAFSRDDVRAGIARSCARLGQERLDLVQFHWWDFAVPRHVEVARWLAELQTEGRIDLLGGTNFDAAHAAELFRAGVRLATMQVQYSVLDTRPEAALAALCARENMRLLCYGTLAGGFLSERWLGAAEPAHPLENRSLTKYKLIIDDVGGWPLFQEILRVLHRVARRHGSDIPSVATRWVLDRPHVACAIVGMRHGRHFDSHRALFGLTLDAADRRDIGAILAQRAPLEGDVYALERDRGGRHGRIMKYDLNT